MFKKAKIGVLTTLLLFLSFVGLSAGPAGAAQVFLNSAPSFVINNWQGWDEDQSVNVNLYHDGSTVQDSWQNFFGHAPGGDVYISDNDACTEIWVHPHTLYSRPPDVGWYCRGEALNSNYYKVSNNQLHYINFDGSLGRALYYATSGPVRNDLIDSGIDVALCRVSVRNWQRGPNCVGSSSLINFVVNFYNGMSPRTLVNLRNGHKPEVIDFPAGAIPSGTLMGAGDHMPALNGYANAVMQTDGNFVIYNQAGTALWSTNTWNHPGAVIVFQSDGNLVVYSALVNGVAIWSSGTNRPCCVNWNLIMQEDRNLVIYDNFGHPVWATGTH